MNSKLGEVVAENISLWDVSGIKVGGGSLDLVVDLVDDLLVDPIVGVKVQIFGFSPLGIISSQIFPLLPRWCGSDVPSGILVE